jgi:MFS family permease
MSGLAGQPRGKLTLALAILLHMFTHAFATILVPLYVLMRRDLNLPGIEYAAFLVSVYGVVYCLFSYVAGILADRFNRRLLLGWGLVFNGIAIVLLGLTRSYWMMVMLAVLGGLAGTLFHPAANSLIPAHFPKSPGMVIGILGIGSGLGFFLGPQYAGYRAVHATWHLWHVAAWQRPCIELGAIGIVCGFLFLLFASETAEHHATRSAKLPLGPHLTRTTIFIACTLGFRDFVGQASLTLTSIYLLKAMNYNEAAAGFSVGAMMLMGVVANPLAVWISPGRKRLPSLIVSLLIAGCVLCTVPLFAARWVLPVMCLFQMFHLGSYALGDAAMFERVDAKLRGRIAGLFLAIAGTAAGFSHWIMGFCVQHLGIHNTDPRAYLPLYITLGILMCFASVSIPLINAMGPIGNEPIDPLTEIDPATMEVAA